MRAPARSFRPPICPPHPLRRTRLAAGQAALLLRAALVSSHALALAILAAGAFGSVPARAELVAERIDASNAAKLQPGGADAVGGIGDWALSNGTLCAVVADPAHEGYLIASGGSLVDLGFCGRKDDELVAFEPLVNLSREAQTEWRDVSASVASGAARIRVEGESGGVHLLTEYALDATDPRRLRITTRLERRAEGERIFAFGDVTIHNDGTLRPYTLARRGFSEGFAHSSTGNATLSELLDAIVPIETVVLVGPDNDSTPISYGLTMTGAWLETHAGERRPVPVFGLSTETVTSLAVLVRPLWLGSGDSLGLLQLAQSLFMDLEPGETLVLEREIRVEARLDAAAFTDRLHAAEPVVRGRIGEPEGEPNARVHFRDERGSAVSQVAPGNDGRFALRLPAGTYTLEVRAAGGRRLERRIEVPATGLDAGTLPLPEPAWIGIPSSLAPARLAFRGEAGTPDPIFEDDLLDFRMGDQNLLALTASSDVHLGGFSGDPVRIAIAPGRYRVYATRGPEFSLSQVGLEIAAGETHLLQLDAPIRIAETPQWIAADLHVHSAPSDDSTVPMRQRLASFLAEGGEVLVATDHDHVTDYAPLIARLGLRDRVRSVVGLEVTSSVSTPRAPKTAGHSNVFPLPYQPLAHRKGAIPSEGRRLRDIIADARAIPGQRLVQLNHGRENSDNAIVEDGAFLSHLSVGRNFAPKLPLPTEQNRSLVETDPATGLRDLDFDAMELLNGPSMPRFESLRADWLSLLRQGHPKTATANSDSHSLHVVAAMPRTYVRLDDDAPARFDEAAFVQSLRSGSAWGTTGPLIEATLGGVHPGERFEGSEGTLRVSVRAAPWVPVSQLRVFVNGDLEHARTITAPADIELPLQSEEDAFVTIEVEGRADALYSRVLPGFTPFAFTNPIFIDADADGVWTPPGLATLPR